MSQTICEQYTLALCDGLRCRVNCKPTYIDNPWPEFSGASGDNDATVKYK